MKRTTQMIQTRDYCSQFDPDKFRVRSQTNPDKFYGISRTGNGLVCECSDHQIRKADCKHIKVILEVVKKNKGFKNTSFRIMERSKPISVNSVTLAISSRGESERTTRVAFSYYNALTVRRDLLPISVLRTNDLKNPPLQGQYRCIIPECP